MNRGFLRADVSDSLNDFYGWVGDWIAAIWGAMVDFTHVIVKALIGFLTTEPPTRETAQLFLIFFLVVTIAVIVMAKQLFKK